jgi:hypothetical protein
MDTFQYTTGGAISYIQQLMRTGDTTLVDVIFSSLNPHYLSEQNLADVLSIYRRTWMVENYEFDTVQFAKLNSIAQQHPTDGGEAVFYARAMLEIDYIDTLDLSNSRNEESNLDKGDNIEWSISPNPTESIVAITIENCTYCTIEILDIAGRILNTVTAKENKTLFNCDALSSGIYFIKIKSESGYEDVKKLILQK